MTKKSTKTRGLLMYLSVIGVCLAFLSSVALAEGTQPIVPEHAFTIAPSIFHILYEEPDVDVEIEGEMYGILGGYTYHKKALFSTSIEYCQGDLDYDGFLQEIGEDGTPQIGDPLQEDSDNWMLEWRAVLGLDFPVGKCLLTPFSGVGYRYWNNKGEGTTSYEREITYWYSPIGIAFFGAFSPRWTFGISGEYDFLWSGKSESDMSDVVYGLPRVHLNFTQQGGYGLRGSLWVKAQLAEHFALSIEPFIRYWDIDESDPEPLTYFGVPIGLALVEPANRTTEYGLLLNLIF
jgi:hypothetical protein